MLRILILLLLCLGFSACEVKVREPDSPLFRVGRDSARTTRSVVRPRVTTDSATMSLAVPPAPAVANSIPSSSAPPLVYDIQTSMGTMRIRLFNETPQHRDNFKKLVDDGFYEGTTFHRVINNFMIQGGDPNSRDNNPFNDGTGSPGYTIPQEIRPDLFHKRGALAAARKPDAYNPRKDSNGSQFFIVQGQIVPPQTLAEMERYVGSAIGDPSFRFSQAAHDIYTTAGGYPMLDRQYTVFGELIDGFEVLDRIAATTTNSQDRPLENITMSIRQVLVQ